MVCWTAFENFHQPLLLLLPPYRSIEGAKVGLHWIDKVRSYWRLQEKMTWRTLKKCCVCTDWSASKKSKKQPGLTKETTANGAFYASVRAFIPEATNNI
jgi:hypothetical protein